MIPHYNGSHEYIRKHVERTDNGSSAVVDNTSDEESLDHGCAGHVITNEPVTFKKHKPPTESSQLSLPATRRSVRQARRAANANTETVSTPQQPHRSPLVTRLKPRTAPSEDDDETSLGTSLVSGEERSTTSVGTSQTQGAPPTLQRIATRYSPNSNGRGSGTRAEQSDQPVDHVDSNACLTKSAPNVSANPESQAIPQAVIDEAFAKWIDGESAFDPSGYYYDTAAYRAWETEGVDPDTQGTGIMWM